MRHPKRLMRYVLLALVAGLWFTCPLRAYAALGASDQAATLNAIASDVQSVITRIERDLTDAAANLAQAGVDGPDARVTVEQLCARRPFFASCITLDASGIVREVAPRRYAGIAGTDISGQPHIARLLAKREPVMSGLFRAAEGFSAVEFGAPVFDRRGKLGGAVSAIVRPDVFLEEIIRPKFSWDALSVWVMQPDSVALFSKEKKYVGRNLKEEAAFSHDFNYLPLLVDIEQNETGIRRFERKGKGHGPPEPRQMRWKTVHLRDQEWRVVLVGPFP